MDENLMFIKVYLILYFFNEIKFNIYDFYLIYILYSFEQKYRDSGFKFIIVYMLPVTAIGTNLT